MASALTLSLLLLAGVYAVLGSTPATIEEYPSVVQVEFAGGYLGFQICSGTIVTNRHIVSAGHCFAGPLFTPRLRRVRAGATRRGRGGVSSRVESVALHPTFGERDHDGDICVVRLASNLVFDASMQSSPIIAQGFHLPPHVTVVHAGWGNTAEQAQIIAKKRDLHSVALRIVDHKACADKYGDLFLPVSITRNMVCAGIDDAGLRYDLVKDGGGPIFYDGILVGVFIMGIPIIADYPVVATSVASYSDWIVRTAV